MARVRENVGRIAEQIADIALTRTVGRPYDRPLFRTSLLGDVYPTADILVDALAADGTVAGHCFVQVKGTAHASPTAPRITVDVKLEDHNRLVRLAIPAYICAVDICTGEVFLVAACQRRKTAVASVTKKFPLTDETIKMEFYREVCAFWTTHGVTQRTSRFTDA